jgi:hypothetical protein
MVRNYCLLDTETKDEVSGSCSIQDFENINEEPLGDRTVVGECNAETVDRL